MNIFTFDVAPRFSPLKEEIEININLNNEDKHFTIKDLIVEIKLVLDIVYLKKEIELFKEKAHLDDFTNILKIKLDDLKLSQIPSNDLLNLSVLEVVIYNKSENFEVSKKFIIQFLKEKGEVYKNII